MINMIDTDYAWKNIREFCLDTIYNSTEKANIFTYIRDNLSDEICDVTIFKVSDNIYFDIRRNI